MVPPIADDTDTQDTQDPSDPQDLQATTTRRRLVLGGVALGSALGAFGLAPGAIGQALAATGPGRPDLKPAPPYRLGPGLRPGLKPEPPVRSYSLSAASADTVEIETEAEATATAPRHVIHRVPARPRRMAESRGLFLNNINTGEVLRITYMKGGRYLPEALKSLNWLMRDRRTNEVAVIDVALLDLLDDITDAAGARGKAIKLISGYRSVKTNEALRAHSHQVARKSYHTRAMAADISIPGMDVPTLFRLAATMKRGGVGDYPSSGFVHVDVGPLRTW